MLVLKVYERGILSWEVSSVIEVTGRQVWGPEFDQRTLVKKGGGGDP